MFSPTFDEHGFASPHTVVQVVTDDMPCLPDSLTAELTRHGFGLHIAIHPVFVVERSLDVTQPMRFGHRFQALVHGTMIESSFLIGSDMPVIGPIANAAMRRFVFPRERCEDIVAHCTDEFSRMTDFLPTMYTHCSNAAMAA